MKKILFVCNNLDHDGISRSLVNLLREIHRDYAVDLLLFHPWGNTRANRRLYRKFDRIACVSRGCRC